MSTAAPHCGASKRWVYYFGDELPPGADPKQLLGGKGASLTEMGRAGLRVPPGFTISTEACQFFYKNNGQWPVELEAQIRENLRRLETDTGRVYGRGPKPLLVSVRSGAAVSMPGMMDTILNCGLHADLAAHFDEPTQFHAVYVQFIASFAKIIHGVHLHPEEHISGDGPGKKLEQILQHYAGQTGTQFPSDPWELLKACINAVFRSWHSERARAYRERHRIEGLAGTAVNVQAMFPSEVSGVLFTQDPNKHAAQQMIIEAAPGLGEAIVSGEVTPDRYVVRRNDFTQFELHPGQRGSAVLALGARSSPDLAKGVNAPSLDAKQVAELSGLAMRIEKHFGKPMDIEWGWAEGQFALLQCRPIRGSEVARQAEACRKEEIERLREMARNHRRFWVTHNLGETLRFPTPLTWDVIRHFMSGQGGFGQMYRDFGYQPSPEVYEHGFLELICGRIYADPDRLAQLFWAGLPLNYDLDTIRSSPAALNNAPTQFDPDKADPELVLRLPKLIRAMLRCSRNLKTLRREIKRHFEEVILPPYLEYVRSKRQQDLTKLSVAELIQEFHDRCGRVLDEFGKESLKPGFFGGVALGELERLLTQILGPKEGTHLAQVLVGALEGDTTVEQDAMLARVTRKEATLDQFLEKIGHRTTNEMELKEPRWREDPTYLRNSIEQTAQVSERCGEARTGAGSAEKYKAAVADLPALLERWGGSSFREEIEGQLRDARALLPYRESGKHYLMMGYELIRLALVELGKRTGLGAGIFFLEMNEVDALGTSAPAGFVDVIQQRKLRWQANQKLYLPDVIDSEQLESVGLPPDTDNTAELKGEPVSSGIATGRVQIVFNPQEAGNLAKDYILVCPSTDPGWTPLFLNACALIVERGGILSHGAIVARDFGIPAVVLPQATSVLKTGEQLRVDGNSGAIARLKEGTSHD